MVLAVKKYLVTASGMKKDTGEPYCWATAVREGQSGSGLNENDRMPLKDLYPVGTTLICDMVLREPAPAKG